MFAPVPFVSKSLRSESYTKLKIEGTKLTTLNNRLSRPSKLGKVFDCRGNQSGEETVCLNNWGVPSQQYLSSILPFTACINTDPLWSGPPLTTWSDDSRWARRWRVRIRGGRKVPEEPLAFTLASLVQVVLLVPLFACSLVVVILF